MSDPKAFRSIVVGLDEAGRSDSAVRTALDLSERLGASLKLTHAVHVSANILRTPEGTLKAAEEADVLAAAWNAQKQHLAPILAAAGRKPEDLETLLSVQLGSPSKVILDTCGTAVADLVMLGTHMRHSVFDFGSTARSILAKSPCAIWVQKEPLEEVRKILVATDLSDDSLNALESACSLARDLEAELEVLHCFYPPVFAYPAVSGYPASGPTYVIDDMREATRKNFERVMSGFDWRGLEVKQVFREGDPTEEILKLAPLVDLVALGTHGHSGLSSAVLGNVAYSVLKQSQTAVLAIRHPDRKWLL